MAKYWVIYHDNKNPLVPLSLRAKDLRTARSWIKDIRAGKIGGISLHRWGVYLVKEMEHFGDDVYG